MKTVTIEDVTYVLPGSWNEFTKDQLLALAKIVDTAKTTIEIQLKLFLFCIEAKIERQVTSSLYILKSTKQRIPLLGEELSSILSVFDFLFEDNENGERYLSPKLTINHFPKIKSRFVWLYGPASALGDITYNQFVWLQTWQSRVSEDSPEMLDEMLNVIYKTKRGKQNVENVRRIDKNIKTVILWYYLGTLSFLTAQFPNVLNGASGDSDSKINVFDNQQRIIDSLADGDVTKKEQVRESYLYDALYSMEMAAVRMQELEKQKK